jgi:hypothetical protein
MPGEIMQSYPLLPWARQGLANIMPFGLNRYAV